MIDSFLFFDVVCSCVFIQNLEIGQNQQLDKITLTPTFPMFGKVRYNNIYSTK